MKKADALIKHIFTFLAVMAFSVTAALSPSDVMAEDASGGTYSLSIDFKTGEEPIEDAEFAIAKVADVNIDEQRFTVLEAYSSIEGDINDTSVENYKDLARKFAEAATVNKKGETDSTGILKFDGLNAGMYVIWETGRDGDSADYAIAAPSLVSLPSWDGDDWETDVTVSPKTERTVLRGTVEGKKSWENDVSSERPSRIRLHLYSDDKEVAETETSASKNWCYSFEGVKVRDENGHFYTFSIKEDEVEGYTFSSDGEKKAPSDDLTYITINIKNTRKPEQAADQTANGMQTGDMDMRIALIGAAAAVIAIAVSSGIKKSGKKKS